VLTVEQEALRICAKPFIRFLSTFSPRRRNPAKEFVRLDLYFRHGTGELDANIAELSHIGGQASDSVLRLTKRHTVSMGCRHCACRALTCRESLVGICCPFNQDTSAAIDDTPSGRPANMHGDRLTLVHGREPQEAVNASLRALIRSVDLNSENGDRPSFDAGRVWHLIESIEFLMSPACASSPAVMSAVLQRGIGVGLRYPVDVVAAVCN
jgi:hypothetical protein